MRARGDHDSPGPQPDHRAALCDPKKAALVQAEGGSLGEDVDAVVVLDFHREIAGGVESRCLAHAGEVDACPRIVTQASTKGRLVVDQDDPRSGGGR